VTFGTYDCFLVVGYHRIFHWKNVVMLNHMLKNILIKPDLTTK